MAASSAAASSSSSAAAGSPLAALRTLLLENKLDAYVIPTADAHQSEYVADCDKRREFVSAFTGSAGTALVTRDAALLWTDSRYFLQASHELTSDWRLMKQGVPGVPTLENWLAENMSAGARIGVDPRITAIATYKRIQHSFRDKSVHIVSEGDRNLVDAVWTTRPPLPTKPLIILPISYTGETTASKVIKLRKQLSTEGAAALVVSALDEVCWLFNLRGQDIPFNPVFHSYALLTADQLTLYIDASQVSDEVKAHLGDSITIKPYDAIFGDLRRLSSRLQRSAEKAEADEEKGEEAKEEATSTAKADDSKAAAASGSDAAISGLVWMDVNKCNLAHYQSVASRFILEKDSPIALPKALKNPVELEGMRQAHRRDAVAVCKFLYWLEQEMEKKVAHTEVTVADRLELFRAEQKDFVGLSFDTISAAGPNGAIIHYHPLAKTARAVTSTEMYLCDSGGQYRDGTTDITRTIHMGRPTDFERMTFTRVLQGHIGLANAVFPTGTPGPVLDILARQALWRVGLDYGHGTGHGVGAFLNVHEGPHGISSTVRAGSVQTTPLQPGMVVTDEPGYYHEGAFGIRIESVLVVEPRVTPHKFPGKDLLAFENITLVPIQRALIDVALLSHEELGYLNAYHARVRELITPLIGTATPFNAAVSEWLQRATDYIPPVAATPTPTPTPPVAAASSSSSSPSA